MDEDEGLLHFVFFHSQSLLLRRLVPPRLIHHSHLRKTLRRRMFVLAVLTAQHDSRRRRGRRRLVFSPVYRSCPKGKKRAKEERGKRPRFSAPPPFSSPSSYAPRASPLAVRPLVHSDSLSPSLSLHNIPSLFIHTPEKL